jgi:quinol monooxygenase YgiN
MKSFLLQIHVQEDKLASAVTALTELEDQGRRDTGCITFAWMQHEKEPRRFTLFEQWESQEALDAHLTDGLLAKWNAFSASLEGAPESTPLRPVVTLREPLIDKEVRAMVEAWFELLSRHVAVDELLSYLDLDRLWMRFPERTITSLNEFRQWYEDIGNRYREQSHRLESLQLSPDSEGVGIELIVVWRATNILDGLAVALRAMQRWHVTRSFLTAAPVISRYEVVGFEQLAP